MKKPGLWQRFSNLVSDGSPLMTRVGQVALLVVCNLCWLICSLPLVTMGPATAALYSVLLERKGVSYDAALVSFFRSFRRYWRKALLLWLPAMVLGAVWPWAAFLTAAQGLMNNAFALLPLLVSGAIWAFTVAWAFPLVAIGVQGCGQVVRRAFLLGRGRRAFRKLDGKYGALRAAGGRDGSLMGGDDLLCDGKPQAGASRGGGTGRIQAVELFKNGV